MHYTNRSNLTKLPRHSRIAASFWDRFWTEATATDPLGKGASELIADLSLYTKVDRILEIGVGDGRNLPKLHELAEHVVGVDISSVALRRAASSVSMLNTAFHLCSACRLPALSDSCDIVVATDLLNHLEKPAILSSEVWRILKRGGKFIGNAMSTRDPSKRGAAVTGSAISPEQLVIPWSGAPNVEPVWVTMRYYGKAELERLFCRFDWVEPPAEYDRNDAGHPPPFDSRPHRHVFWKIIVQKPRGLRQSAACRMK